MYPVLFSINKYVCSSGDVYLRSRIKYILSERRMKLATPRFPCHSPASKVSQKFPGGVLRDDQEFAQNCSKHLKMQYVQHQIIYNKLRITVIEQLKAVTAVLMCYIHQYSVRFSYRKRTCEKMTICKIHSLEYIFSHFPVVEENSLTKKRTTTFKGNFFACKNPLLLYTVLISLWPTLMQNSSEGHSEITSSTKLNTSRKTHYSKMFNLILIRTKC